MFFIFVTFCVFTAPSLRPAVMFCFSFFRFSARSVFLSFSYFSSYLILFAPRLRHRINLFFAGHLFSLYSYRFTFCIACVAASSGLAASSLGPTAPSAWSVAVRGSLAALSAAATLTVVVVSASLKCALYSSMHLSGRRFSVGLFG